MEKYGRQRGKASSSFFFPLTLSLSLSLSLSQVMGDAVYPSPQPLLCLLLSPPLYFPKVHTHHPPSGHTHNHTTSYLREGAKRWPILRISPLSRRPQENRTTTNLPLPLSKTMRFAPTHPPPSPSPTSPSSHLLPLPLPPFPHSPPKSSLHFLPLLDFFFFFPKRTDSLDYDWNFPFVSSLVFGWDRVELHSGTVLRVRF